MTDQDNHFPVVAKGEIGGTMVQTVNARDLHDFLEVGKVFGAWIVERIAQYEFSENADYVVFSQTGNNPLGGRPAKEYAISIDMAKELAMVERNEKGKQARQYFIQCERIAKDPLSALNDPAAMRGLLLTYTERVILLQGQVEEMGQKVNAFGRIAEGDGSLAPTDAAKTLQVQPKELFGVLRGPSKWVYRRAGSAEDIAYQDKIQQGLLEHKIVVVSRADGSEKTITRVRITPKGLARLAEYFENRPN